MWAGPSDTSPPPFPGYETNATTKWGTGFGAWTFEFCDIWENGERMADGRTFQVTATPWQSDGYIFYSSTSRINIPVVYEHGNDELNTCIGARLGENVSLHMRGRFVIPGSVYGHSGAFFIGDKFKLPNGYIPCTPDSTAANNAWYTLTGLINHPFNIASCIWSQDIPDLVSAGPTYGILPTPYYQYPSTGTANQTRRCVTTYGQGERDCSTFAEPELRVMATQDSSGQALRARSGVASSDLPDVRTYRRGDSPPIDWPGLWAP